MIENRNITNHNIKNVICFDLVIQKILHYVKKANKCFALDLPERFNKIIKNIF